MRCRPLLVGVLAGLCIVLSGLGGRAGAQDPATTQTALTTATAAAAAASAQPVPPPPRPVVRLQVDAVTPSGEADPLRTPEIRVAFTAPLDPATVQADALSLKPAAPGRIRLVGDRTLVLQLASPLKLLTRYQIEFSKALRGGQGELPPETLHLLTTSALRLLEVTAGGLQRDRSLLLTFTFNSAVSPQALLQRLVVRGPGGVLLRKEAVGNAPAPAVQIRLENALYDRLEVLVEKGLAGTDGPIALAAPSRSVLPVRTSLEFLGIRPVYQTWRESKQRYIQIRANSPLDITQIAPFIAIAPAIPFTLDPSSEGADIIADFEPGARYEVTLKAGMPGGVTGVLLADVTRSAWFPDRPASVAFPASGYLTSKGLMAIPLRSVNTDRAKLFIDRLYPSNLVSYALDRDGWALQDLGTSVIEEEVRLEERKNAEVDTLVDLRPLLKDQGHGIFSLRVRDIRRDWDQSQALVVVTDLGLSARVTTDRAWVWVTDLPGAQPVRGVALQLYSDRRQLLGEGRSGADGVAEIEIPDLPEGERPALVIARRGDDTSYLLFEGSGRTRSVEGSDTRSYLREGYEVFTTCERGVYRPGDLVRISALVRGVRWAVPRAMPLDLVVRKPDGKIFLRTTVLADEAGRLLKETVVPVEAPSGNYAVQWTLPGKDAPLGATSFRLADYIPQTLRMQITAPEGRLAAAEPFRVTARVQHLFGDPAAHLQTKCRVDFTAAPFAPADWKDFVFGDSRNQSAQQNTVTLPDQKLDADGQVTYQIPAPNLKPAAAVQARVEVEALETGGRALTEPLTRLLDPWPAYLGIRPAETAPESGKSATFSFAAVLPAGAPKTDAGAYQARLFRVNYSNLLRRQNDGRLVYDWVRSEEPVGTAEGRFAQGRASAPFDFRFSGSYRLLLESENACPAVYDFWVGGEGAEWVSDNPEAILLKLDKTAYRPGETARLQIRAPFPGTVLLTVEATGVLETRVLNLKTGEATESFKVRADWRPNVYLAATLVRPVAPEKDWRAHRASGAVRLLVDNTDRELPVEILAPVQAGPGRQIELAVRVGTKDEPQRNAAVVLAAVDEGVLALSAFKTPSPWDYFYAARRLEVRDYDMFSKLAPELEAWRVAAKLTPGGGEGEGGAALGRRLSPIQAKRVKTAVLYDGTLLTDSRGIARVTVDVPEYVGELRVMAYAAHRDRFGRADRALPVRSALMARPSWPRFVAPGDVFLAPVSLFNRTGRDGKVEVSLDIQGPVETTATLPLSADVPTSGEGIVRIPLRATGVGVAHIRLTARLGDDSYTESVELPVRPAAGFTRSGGGITLEPGVPQTLALPGNCVPGTGKVSLVVAGSPLVELGGALQYLLQYPYGCAEQTVSSMVPLLYLADLAALSGEHGFERPEVARLLDAGFTRLRMMQTYGGGLAWWPGQSNPEAYPSLYAADFLVEARKAGFDVPQELLDPLLQYLQREIGNWEHLDAQHYDEAGRAGMMAYGCYVLARAGRAPYTWMTRLEERVRAAREGKGPAIPVSARFHLAAAFLAAGQPAGSRLFTDDTAPTARAREMRGYFNSPNRETAILLQVLLDVDPQSARIPALVERLRRGMHLGRWGTTQENAFALLALGKYARRNPAPAEGEAVVTLPNGESRTVDPLRGAAFNDLQPGESVQLRFNGKGRLYAFWNLEGVPSDGSVPESDSGMAVRRTFLTADGSRPADPANLRQGEVYRVRISVRADQRLSNLVLLDLLPAGLEIIDPNLRGTTAILGERGADGSYWFRVSQVERRDDRLLVFGEAPMGDCVYTYAVRAVTAGTFVLPAMDASCMYDPDLVSVHGRGHITIRP